MASRDISGPLLRSCYAATRKGVTPSKILTLALEGIVEAQQTMDMTGDMDVHDYFTGYQDAFLEIAHMIAPLKENKHAFWMSLLSMTRVPEENQK